jgi:flagellar hook-basal body complex protein FliE
MLQAEQTLQTAIAIRDKVVSAFLEVTKMQM